MADKKCPGNLNNIRRANFNIIKDSFNSKKNEFFDLFSDKEEQRFK